MYYCTNTGCIFRNYKGYCDYGCTCSAAKSIPKPPLGVVSRDIWDRKRQEELAEAMKRYLEAGEKIPSEWISEYNEISDRWEE